MLLKDTKKGFFNKGGLCTEFTDKNKWFIELKKKSDVMKNKSYRKKIEIVENEKANNNANIYTNMTSHKLEKISNSSQNILKNIEGIRDKKILKPKKFSVITTTGTIK